MIKLIFWSAAAVSLEVAAILPYAESRLLSAYNDKFHPEEKDSTSPVSVQLVCNYVPCEATSGRRLGSFNDKFHPNQSQTFCLTQLDFDQEELGARHLMHNTNDEFHFSPSGTYCLVPPPE